MRVFLAALCVATAGAAYVPLSASATDAAALQPNDRSQRTGRHTSRAQSNKAAEADEDDADLAAAIGANLKKEGYPPAKIGLVGAVPPHPPAASPPSSSHSNGPGARLPTFNGDAAPKPAKIGLVGAVPPHPPAASPPSSSHSNRPGARLPTFNGDAAPEHIRPGVPWVRRYFVAFLFLFLPIMALLYLLLRPVEKEGQAQGGAQGTPSPVNPPSKLAGQGGGAAELPAKDDPAASGEHAAQAAAPRPNAAFVATEPISAPAKDDPAASSEHAAQAAAPRPNAAFVATEPISADAALPKEHLSLIFERIALAQPFKVRKPHAPWSLGGSLIPGDGLPWPTCSS